jgi:hypothetical protein
MSDVANLMSLLGSRGRVCPREQPWKYLWGMVAGEAHNSLAGPLKPAAWEVTSRSMKEWRLRRQLEAAARNGTFPHVRAFLLSLKEDEWVHHDDRESAGRPPAARPRESVPEPERRTVALHVRTIGGQLTQQDGTPLPQLADYFGVLVLPADAIVSEVERRRLTQETTRQILAAGEALLCRVSGDRVPDDLQAQCWFRHVDGRLPKDVFVEVLLHEPLKLMMRGGKHAKLMNATCSIPSLGQRRCESLNEAYRRVSESFEPTRRSVSGNAFVNFYYLEEVQGRWAPLGDLRDQLEP